MEQIFGEENHVGNISIMHNPKGRDAEHISSSHEYMILYAKNLSELRTNDFIHTDDELARKFPKLDDYGSYRELPLKRTGSDSLREDRPLMFFPFLYDEIEGKITLLPDEEYNRIYNKNLNTFDDPYLNDLKARYEQQGLQFILPVSELGRPLRWRWVIPVASRQFITMSS